MCIRDRTITGVINHMGGDASAKNPSRLMRLGGSIAWPKKEGRVAELTEVKAPEGVSDAISIEALQKTYPLEEKKPSNNITTISHGNRNQGLNLGGSTWDLEQVSEMMKYLDPDMPYHEWLKVGMALHQGGHPFSIWDDWSRKGTKYKAGDCDYRWRGFKHNGGVSFGTVVYTAKEHGWRNDNVKREQIEPAKSLSVRDVNINPETGEVMETLPYTWARDIKPLIEVNNFVQGVLGQGQFSVVYGESNCGKTFFVTDLAFHVAMGRKWRDKRVDKGGVIYVALEGSYGLNNRIQAFKQENQEAADMPLAVITTAIDFLSPDGNLAMFIETIKQAAKEVGDIKLVVIDTLARAIAGGDENSGQDMGLLVKAADLIRAHTGAHICFVHHCGKDKAKGARGHSSLRAAVDTEIEIAREENESFSAVKIVKQRDMEKGEDMFFTLKRITLGVNKYNEEVTSCTVMPIDAPEKISSENGILTINEQFIYEAILETLISVGRNVNLGIKYGTKQAIDYDQLTDELSRRGYKDLRKQDGESTVKTHTNSARIALRQKNKINFNDTYIWLLK